MIDEEHKKRIIKQLVEMMRPANIEMITRVLTDEEEKLRDQPNYLVSLVENNMRSYANKRLDEILKINEII